MNDLVSNQECVKVLRAIRSGNGFHLPQYTHLTSMQVEMCLSLLEENSLIEKDESYGYKITQNGIQYLTTYDKFVKILSEKNWEKEQIAV
jgi:hypothetical protein